MYYWMVKKFHSYVFFSWAIFCGGICTDARCYDGYISDNALLFWYFFSRVTYCKSLCSTSPPDPHVQRYSDTIRTYSFIDIIVCDWLCAMDFFFVSLSGYSFVLIVIMVSYTVSSRTLCELFYDSDSGFSIFGVTGMRKKSSVVIP